MKKIKRKQRTVSRGFHKFVEFSSLGESILENVMLAQQIKIIGNQSTLMLTQSKLTGAFGWYSKYADTIPHRTNTFSTKIHYTYIVYRK